MRAQDEYAAKVLVQMGQVSILKDSQPQPLFVGNMVRPKQIIITGPDSYAKFGLRDGSTFEVFSNAQVAFRDNYPNIGDLVQLLLGRIRVFIDHSKGENRNRVVTPTALISVRGTIFDVVQDDDNSTLVSVEEGIVGVRHRLMTGEIELHANESVRVIPNQPLAAQRIDKTPLIRGILNAAKQALYEVASRPGQVGSTGSPVPPASGGPQADKDKSGGTTNGGTSAPPPPPAPPPAPPPPPPGGGGD
jgi:hypothetical protein